MAPNLVRSNSTAFFWRGRELHEPGARCSLIFSHFSRQLKLSDALARRHRPPLDARNQRIQFSGVGGQASHASPVFFVEISLQDPASALVS